MTFFITLVLVGITVAIAYGDVIYIEKFMDIKKEKDIK